MRKKTIVVCLIICLSMLLVITGVASAVSKDDRFHLAGLFFNSANDNKLRDTTIVASYNGQDITTNTVDYQRKMNIFRSEEAAKEYDTDIQIVNRIIESMLILEEAERLGFAATDAEIEEMVANTTGVYAMPEGKKIIDAYCKGAGITVEEYFELQREQAPRVIARQKLMDAVGKQYCDENGLTFTKVNPPKEMLQAQEAYIEKLFAEHKADIVYYIEDE